jgi:hypothetical protein
MKREVITMMEQPIWFKYAIYDEDGVCGVRNDAPDDVKKAYAAYVQEQEKAGKDGIKL